MMRLSRAVDRAILCARPALRSSASAVRLPQRNTAVCSSSTWIARPAVMGKISVRPFAAQTAWRASHTQQQTNQQRQQQDRSDDKHQQSSDDASSSASSSSSLLPLLRRLLTFVGVASVSAVGTFQLLAHCPDALRWLGDSAGEHIAAIASSAGAPPPQHANMLLSPRESSGLSMPGLTATNVIIGINIAVWVMHNTLPMPFMHRHFLSSWAHIQARPPLYHTLLTSVFSHMTPMHLGFNCFALYMFGGGLEQDLGTKDFVLFFLAAGVLSSVGSLVMARSLGSKSYRLACMSQPGLGASGAVFGLIGLQTVLHPNQGYSVLGISPYYPAQYFFPTMVGLDLAAAMYYLFRNQTSGIGHWAHISGYLVGIVWAMTYLRAFNSRVRAKMEVEKQIKQRQARAN